MIIWAGTSNKDVGMVIEHYPRVIVPVRSQEIQQVPGRNGAIVIPTGSFENYEQQYQAFLDAKYIGGLEQAIPKLTSWLLGNEGYQRLEDSYFPDVYRMAYYSGGSEFVSIFNEYGEGTLSFNCAPEKFLKFGEWPIDVKKGDKLLNPTSFTAFPLLKIRGNGYNGKLIFNDAEFEIKTVPDTIYIDVKQHRAYNGLYRYSSLISGHYEDLQLHKETTISFTGGIVSVSITPRWWTI